jgi:diadenosine tetraphosphate (Ap4A) HIT family hydrolase
MDGASMPACVEGCRFCYLPEPWRVVWSTEHFNVQMGLGPLAEGYALILSRSHYSCCAELPETLAAEFEDLVRLVRRAQLRLYGESLMFEHGRSGACLPPGNGEDLCYHAHLHFLPAQVDLADSIASDFPALTFDDWAAVRRRYRQTSRPYLLAGTSSTDSTSAIAFAETPDQIRSRYLRRIAAASLGMPELEDWVAFPSYPVVRAGLDKLANEISRLSKGPEHYATTGSAEGRAV